MSLLGVERWGVSRTRLQCQKRHLTPSQMAMATFLPAEDALLLPNQEPLPVRRQSYTPRGRRGVDALKAKIGRIRQFDDFASRAKRLLERDRDLLKRLAQ